MVPLHNILFLDIETVSQHAAYAELNPEWRLLWDKKAEQLLRGKTDQLPEDIYGRSAIYAEFGKVICISCGILSGTGEDKKLIIKSFYDDDEPALLSSFCDMISRWSEGGPRFLCAHNGKEFDYPYLCRRMIINDVCIPEVLSIAGKKPWEVNHLDTMELWKFGDYKSYTSLNLLAHALGIPTPKDDIDGSMVGEVYWKQKDLARIAAYCQKDVITLAQIYLRLNREAIVATENIEYKS